MYSYTIRQITSNMARTGFYGSPTERILGCSHNSRPANLDLCTRSSSFNEESTRRNDEDLKAEFGLLHKQEPWRVQSRQNPIDKLTTLNLIQQRVHLEQRILSEFSRSNHPSLDQTTRDTGFKRKALNFELDLNLSLGLESRNDGQQDEENLSLSLYTTPSPSMLIYKKLKEDFGTENAREASTLDLTL